MTLDEVTAMTDEQVRIKVAELLGWRPYSANKNEDPDELWLLNTYSNVLPKYHSDLNACREMEDTMSHRNKRLFVVQLSYVLSPAISPQSFRLIHATARQRCEAFILTRSYNEES